MLLLCSTCSILLLTIGWIRFKVIFACLVHLGTLNGIINIEDWVFFVCVFVYIYEGVKIGMAIPERVMPSSRRGNQSGRTGKGGGIGKCFKLCSFFIERLMAVIFWFYVRRGELTYKNRAIIDTFENTVLHIDVYRSTISAYRLNLNYG